VVAYGVVYPVDCAVVGLLLDDLEELALPRELGDEGCVHALDLGLSEGLRVLSCG